MNIKREIIYTFIVLVAITGLSCSKAAKPDRFFVNDKGFIIDRNKSLMWASIDNGSDISWEKAAIYCKHFRGGGFHDWRMPFLSELKAIFPNKNSKLPNIRKYLTIDSKKIWSADINHTIGTAGYFLIDDSLDAYGLIYGNIRARALPVRNIKN